MNKHFAIFDMDGTLVDSMIFWRRLGREYLNKKNITENVDEILDHIKTMTMSESAALFAKELGLTDAPQTVENEMNDIINNHYCMDIPLKSGVRKYLEKLHRTGVKMCVASATAEPLMHTCLSRLGVLEYFSFLLSCETVGAGKSQPDVFLEAANRLGALPEETAVYEDALYAARTAKNAGFYTIAVYDNSSKKDWKEMTDLADEVIYDWMEVNIDENSIVNRRQ